MCRFLAYQGVPVLLESVVSRPCHSLIHQSLHASEAKTGTNGDGFGLGWYGERPEPGIYRDLRPAWSDDNLQSICEQVRSPLFFAHVRAATGTATARANCHPFSLGSSMFMHNGQVGGYTKIRRSIEALIPDDVYDHRGGTTDSEAIFLAAMAQGAAEDPIRAFGAVLSGIRGMMAAAGIEQALRFSAAFTNGTDLYAFRWACDASAPTLYWRHDGTSLQIVSEPLDDMHASWTAIAQSSVLVSRQGGAPEARDFAISC